jgi:predicted RNase H-like HicB family nuclease
MSDKLIAYPAIFRPLHNEHDTYIIKFPDLPNTFTEGYGLNDAYVMASDVLAEMNYDNNQLPEPSTPNTLELDDDEFVAVITANLSAKKRELQKFVRKNVTVPADLAQRAQEQGLNFSQTLSEALEEKLGV